MTLEENKREHDTFHTEVLLSDNPLFAILITAAPSGHISMRNVCNVSVRVGILGSETARM